MLYAHNECCGHVELSDTDDDWTSIFDEFAKSVYDGKYQEGQIPNDLYFKTANKLADSVVKGLPSEFAYDNPANILAAQLKANLYQFSAAKSLVQAELLRDMILDDKGDIKPFNQYRDEVLKINKNYNVRYLNAEYNNTVAGTQMAVKWKNLEHIGAEYLEYRTAGDDRVRQSHKDLDGVVLHINSPVWNRIYPPNDWACRCIVVPADKPVGLPPEKTDDKLIGKEAKKIVTNPIFDNNIGKSSKIFIDGHPYFKTAGGDINELNAIKNYGFQSFEKIMMNASKYPAPLHIDTINDYYTWWNDVQKKYGTGKDLDFVLTDKLGSKILFDGRDAKNKKAADFFKDHILRKKEGRHEYAANLIDIIQNPDEVWCRIEKKTLEWHYWKYYNDGIYLITVLNKDNILTAETIYKVNNYKVGGILKKRGGVLLYKK